MKREELLKSREYWISKIQIDLFNLIENYRKSKGYTKTELASELGFTKGYITQILNGEFDHKVSKLVDLSLAFGKVPELNFTTITDYIENDEVSSGLKSIKVESNFINSTLKNNIDIENLIDIDFKVLDIKDGSPRYQAA